MKTIKDLLVDLARSDEPMVDGLEEWAEPIADYLQASGAVVLPVRIGQTVYVVDKADINNPIKEQIVVEIKFGYSRNVFVLQSRPTCIRIDHAFYDFGRAVFASYAEAKNSLMEK
jgi:hypothetical protein